MFFRSKDYDIIFIHRQGTKRVASYVPDYQGFKKVFRNDRVPSIIFVFQGNIMNSTETDMKRPWLAKQWPHVAFRKLYELTVQTEVLISYVIDVQNPVAF